MTNSVQTSVFSIPRSLLISGLLLASSATLKLLSPEYISVGLAHRVLGVMLGMLVVAYANAVPKLLMPLLRKQSDAAVEQAMRRFTGTTLLLGGVGFSLAWMIAPLESAALVSAGLLGTALLLVVVRFAWMMAKMSRNKAA